MSQKSDCCKVIIVKADNNSRVNSVAVEYVTNLLNEESTNNGHCNSVNDALLNDVSNGSKGASKINDKNKIVRNCQTNLPETDCSNIDNASRINSTKNSNDYFVKVMNRIDDLDKDLKSDRKTASKRHKTILQSIGIIFFILVGLIITAIAYAVKLLASRQV